SLPLDRLSPVRAGRGDPAPLGPRGERAADQICHRVHRPAAGSRQGPRHGRDHRPGRGAVRGRGDRAGPPGRRPHAERDRRDARRPRHDPRRARRGDPARETMTRAEPRAGHPPRPLRTTRGTDRVPHTALARRATVRRRIPGAVSRAQPPWRSSMKIDHEFTVSVPVDRAWAVLTDLEAIAPCMPGAQLTGVDGDVYSGTVKIKVGPVVSQYAGNVKFLEKDDAGHRAVIDARGRDARGGGNASAVVTAQLHPDGDRTRVTVETDLKITGRIAQFGSGMIKEVSNKLL